MAFGLAVSILGSITVAAPLLAQEPAGLLGTPAVRKLMAESRDEGLIAVIVRFGRGAPYRLEGTLDAAEALVQREAMAAVREGVLASLGDTDHAGVKRYRTLPLMAVHVGPEALERLARHPDVVAIYPDALLAPQLSRSIPSIGADTAWAAGHSGAGQAVAILDTGVDGDHPFLAGKIVSEACYSTTSARATSVCPGGVSESTATGSGVNCPLTTNSCDHGTHVAGTVAGRGAGFSGVARDASVIAIQVFSQVTDVCGARSPCVLSFTSDLIKGLERVAEIQEMGIANVAAANLSLGGGQFAGRCDNDPTKLAIDNLKALGIATVVASGNQGFDGFISSPGCVSTAVTVGAVDRNDRVAGFSNYASIVDLMGPGVRINSSVPGDGFARFSGTSMATAHVAGAFAILQGADPGATVDQIEAALIDTGRAVTRAGVTEARIQVDAALDRLLSMEGPANDRLGDALVLEGLAGSVTGSNVGATAQRNEPTHAGVGGGRSVWWRWRAPRDGTARFDTFGSTYDTVLAVYRGRRISRVREVASNDDAEGGEPTLLSAVEIEVRSGQAYRIAVDGFQGDTGNIVLNYFQDGAGGANDLFADAIELEGWSGVSSGNNVGATSEPGEPVHAGLGGGRSVWWQWTAPRKRSMIVTTLGSGFDTVLAVYTGRAVKRLREVASNDDFAGLGQQSLVQFGARRGTTYRIAVDGFAGEAGSTAEGEVSLIFRPAQQSGPARVAGGPDLSMFAAVTRRAEREGRRVRTGR